LVVKSNLNHISKRTDNHPKLKIKSQTQMSNKEAGSENDEE
jgi:hypothetical protein